MKPWRFFLAVILCCGVGVGLWLIGCGDDDPVVICNDLDGDGYGNPISFLCPSCGLDCDDSNADVNPGETEGPPGDATCSDGLDNDCNGHTDADDPNCQAGTCTDNDGDGYGDPASAACTFPQLDCDDTNADVNPGETEGPFGDATCSDSLDNNCNGQTDGDDANCQEAVCTDDDGDGYGDPASAACTFPQLDCDDTNADVNPGETEGPVGDATCSDSLDNDCNGQTDGDDANCQEAVCTDNDEDGYGDPASDACDLPELDCDDTNADVNPGETEGPVGDPTCSDTLDNDCNGQTDAEDTQCQGGPATVTLSGKLTAITALPPYPEIAGATVELYEDPSNSTTSGGDGSWELEDVPADEDAFIKITAAGYATAINVIPVSQGVVQYDLQILDPAIYGYLIGGAGPDKCLVFGAVVGFIDEEYPQEIQMLAGATVSVTPATLDVVYLNDFGLKDPSLTETSSQGAFLVVVPDANAITSVSLTATRTGSQLEGPPSYPTLAGGFVLAGLVDTLFVP